MAADEPRTSGQQDLFHMRRQYDHERSDITL
jgi:hypothetical protein